MITKFLILTTVLLTFFKLSESAQEPKDYCTKNCGKEKHTLCRTGQPCKTLCGADTTFSYLTAAQKESVLHLHNQIRNKLAGGEDMLGGFAGVKVADMQIMSYRNEAEYILSCHLKTQCEMKHDVCRNLFDDISCGQNIYILHSTNAFTEEQYNGKDVFTNHVKLWYDEINDCGCDYTKFTSSYVGDKAVGHLTQLIWGATKFIGCNKITYKVEGQFPYRLLSGCNYCPSGNIYDRPYFTVGEPGPGCGADPRYPNLCGKQLDLRDDPFELSTASLRNGRLVFIVCVTTLFALIF